MPVFSRPIGRVLFALCVAQLLLSQANAILANGNGPSLLTADIGNGIRLHYVEMGSGAPVVFVHGSLSDYEYWSGQIGPFSKHYRDIAYSRRYDFPNTNPARSNYSAATDADDLARLIEVLKLGKAVLIGHSYGALVALFLAVKRPDLVRALVLAEPPAVNLLQHASGNGEESGKAMFEDIQIRMVTPVRRAFLQGKPETGVATFIDYVLEDPQAWSKMPQSSRNETLRDINEWQVMMTTGTLFPELAPEKLNGIRAPALLLCGAKTYPFLRVISSELGRLLPNAETIVLPNAGHQMWIQHPDLCRTDVEAFLARSGVR